MTFLRVHGLSTLAVEDGSVVAVGGVGASDSRGAGGDGDGLGAGGSLVTAVIVSGKGTGDNGVAGAGDSTAGSLGVVSSVKDVNVLSAVIKDGGTSGDGGLEGGVAIDGGGSGAGHGGTNVGVNDGDDLSARVGSIGPATVDDVLSVARSTNDGIVKVDGSVSTAGASRGGGSGGGRGGVLDAGALDVIGDIKGRLLAVVDGGGDDGGGIGGDRARSTVARLEGRDGGGDGVGAGGETGELVVSVSIGGGGAGGGRASVSGGEGHGDSREGNVTVLKGAVAVAINKDSSGGGSGDKLEDRDRDVKVETSGEVDLHDTDVGEAASLSEISGKGEGALDDAVSGLGLEGGRATLTGSGAEEVEGKGTGDIRGITNADGRSKAGKVGASSKGVGKVAVGRVISTVVLGDGVGGATLVAGKGEETSVLLGIVVEGSGGGDRDGREADSAARRALGLVEGDGEVTLSSEDGCISSGSGLRAGEGSIEVDDATILVDLEGVDDGSLGSNEAAEGDEKKGDGDLHSFFPRVSCKTNKKWWQRRCFSRAFKEGRKDVSWRRER